MTDTQKFAVVVLAAIGTHTVCKNVNARMNKSKIYRHLISG